MAIGQRFQVFGLLTALIAGAIPTRAPLLEAVSSRAMTLPGVRGPPACRVAVQAGSAAHRYVWPGRSVRRHFPRELDLETYQEAGVSLASKLQLKPGHAVALLHVPRDLTIELPAGSTATTSPHTADAVVVFVQDTTELEERAGPALQAARRDALAWIAYPKAGKLGTDLNRDRLWQHLEGRGVRPVRQVAVDDTWSALRFRPS